MATTPLVRSHGLTVHPATHARFDDVRTMIGPKNPTSSVCWCLSHRIPARDNQALTGPERGDFVEALTRRRTKPGVLAYDEDEVVGWAAVAPRADLPFARSTKIPHVDDLPVWSLWCIRAGGPYRGDLGRFPPRDHAPLTVGEPAGRRDRRTTLCQALAT